MAAINTSTGTTIAGTITAILISPPDEVTFWFWPFELY